MSKTMLIDASHIEEMRMAILEDGRLEGFEIESAQKKQLKGSIFLAKVIRVEPSLQAAFVEYGGNRQGFLPFSEIHPDYYQIPVADRVQSAPSEDIEISNDSDATEMIEGVEPDDQVQPPLDMDAIDPEFIDVNINDLEPTESDTADSISLTEDDFDEESVKKHRSRPQYKIQEVIKRRQILLIQVIKEERGNKGAAVSTYLSLPGRYCVLMPNAGTSKGGISRKITDQKDRKRLRAILDSLDLFEGMSLIVRTAGSKRNKTEIKKDFEYLLRLWIQIRETTLASIAPTCVYEEGNLIKRALRDTYSKDVDYVVVDGEEAFKTARTFMQTLSPSHAKKIQLYKEKPLSLFQKHHVDDMVDEIFQPTISLPSGGSIVFAQTEALVAVDVNSGKATKERNLNETALKTNLEAAREVARQLRLRDLSGLVVVDFIDMGEKAHIQHVEKTFKDAMSKDRARIQIGRISQFGLLELSRQRLRPSLIENYTRPCEHCHGVGRLRSVDSMALFILRQIESACIQNPNSSITVFVPHHVDSYILNKKRNVLIYLENHYTTQIHIYCDAALSTMDYALSVDSKTALEVHPVTTTDLVKKQSKDAPQKTEKTLEKKQDDSHARKHAPQSDASPEKKQNDGTQFHTHSEKKSENTSKRKRRRTQKPIKEKSNENEKVVEESVMSEQHPQQSTPLHDDAQKQADSALESQPEKRRNKRRRNTRKKREEILENAPKTDQQPQDSSNIVSRIDNTPASANDKTPTAPEKTKRKKGLWERLFDS